MSHRRKSKDQRKAERESNDAEILCIPHITLDITDFLCEREAVIGKGTHHPVPEQLTLSGPKVFFCVDGGEKEHCTILDLVNIYDDPMGDRHFTFSGAIVSIVISRFDIEELLRIQL